MAKNPSSDVANFVSVTGARKEEASRYMELHENLSDAINAFYNDESDGRRKGGAGRGANTMAKKEASLNKLFDKYKDPDGDIGVNGTIKWCEDLSVDPEDVVLLAVAYELKSPSMGVWKRDGWVNGWKSLGRESIDGMRRTLTTLSSKLASDPRYFRKVYSYTFDFARPEGQRALALDEAQAFWSLLIPVGLVGGALRHIVEGEEDENEDEDEDLDEREGSGDVRPGEDVRMSVVKEEGWKHEYTDWWFEFLREKGGKGVSKDTWLMFLEFVRTIDSKFQKHDEYAAWPSTIDDFVAWARKKIEKQQKQI